jgi:hypothetical protein
MRDLAEFLLWFGCAAGVVLAIAAYALRPETDKLEKEDDGGRFLDDR